MYDSPARASCALLLACCWRAWSWLNNVMVLHGTGDRPSRRLACWAARGGRRRAMNGGGTSVLITSCSSSCSRLTLTLNLTLMLMLTAGRSPAPGLDGELG